MSANINRVFIAGRLTRDPQIRFLANEKAVADLGVVVNRKFKDGSGEMREEATFIDCEAWGKLAESCGQYLKKGSSVFIEGRLKLDQWEDKDGQKRSKIKVAADNVQFLDRAPRDEQTASDPAAERPQRAAPSRAAGPAPAAADDMPPF